MTTIIKKDGTRKAVKVNGFVSEKSITFATLINGYSLEISVPNDP